MGRNTAQNRSSATTESDSSYDKMASDIVENLDVEALKQKRMKNLENKGKFFFAINNIPSEIFFGSTMFK